jgi:hypothetical protein
MALRGSLEGPRAPLKRADTECAAKASFADGGLTYNVFLQRSKMPDSEGLHYRWLFPHFGEERAEGCLLVVTGSKEETALLGLLRDFMASRTLEAASTIAPHENRAPYRLTELVYIERREPCFPSDLAGRPEGDLS